ncbi:MAG: hypothetical protein HKN81_11460 [Gammaproteobacteria bacterium]|nr:hypothetical protein [Gammaproteobacteria bacterium]
MGNRFVVKAALTSIALAATVSGTAVAQPGGIGPEEINGRPNLSGVWQAMNTANWNLEAHSAEALDEFWELGSLAAIPAGKSVVVEGTIPYNDEGLAQREENRAGWPEADPETVCYLPGIPRANYMPYPFQILQTESDILFVYSYASANRLVEMDEELVAPVDTWMGQSNGDWDGDVLVIETHAMNGKPWLDRAGNHMSRNAIVTERLELVTPDHIMYEATISDPTVFTDDWTIRMPLYRNIEENAQILEHKCVPHVENLLYSDLIGLE